ncbi:MAG: Response regulator receiver domain [Armatimonadetes bacterium]|jgi:CheY-like chemotaxis protein|nr:Response regulator receiver domain [Armatimonadota bacterium]
MVVIHDTDEQPVQQDPSLRGNGLRVLLIEGRDEAREILGELLEALGYDVATAPDASGAWNAATAPAAVVVDLALPGGAAVELLQALRSQPGWESVRGIGLCPREDAAVARRATEAGYAAVLTKPISIWALHAALQAD